MTLDDDQRSPGVLDALAALEKEATKGPWAWRDFGKSCLVADYGRRDIVLCDAKTRDHHSTLLVQASDEHPDMKFIAAIRNAAPFLIEVARYASSLLSEEGAFEAISHFNVAFGLKDALARLEGVGK